MEGREISEWKRNLGGDVEVGRKEVVMEGFGVVVEEVLDILEAGSIVDSSQSVYSASLCSVALVFSGLFLQGPSLSSYSSSQLCPS